MGMTVLDVLRKEITEQLDAAKGFVAAGRPKDYADYRETCGLLRGLGYALEAIDKLSRDNLEDNDYE